MNYHFEDFTESNYEIMLQKLINGGYEFACFDYEKINSDTRFVLWRHDVDYSLNRAYRLAEIEASLGIKATYFIYMHGSFYNIFESSQYKVIEGIISKGHAIGLHFDHGFYVQNKYIPIDDDIEQYAVREKEIIEQYFDINICVVSFHNPEANNVLNLQKDYYAGMVNAYSKTIFDSCKYCSDSNGYWRYDRLSDVIGNGYEKLHILTHPVWWTPYEMSPYERIKRCAEGRKNAAVKLYCDILKQYGRENVGYKPNVKY